MTANRVEWKRPPLNIRYVPHLHPFSWRAETIGEHPHVHWQYASAATRWGLWLAIRFRDHKERKAARLRERYGRDGSVRLAARESSVLLDEAIRKAVARASLRAERRGSR